MRKNNFLIPNSHSFMWSALFFTFLIILTGSNISAQTSKVKISNEQISNKQNPEHARSIAEISEDADLIAVGKVTDLASEWAENKSSIRTIVTIQTNETIKGTLSGSSLSILIPGGEIDGVGEWYSHSVQFKKDEDVVVFVKKDKKDHFIISDGERGKFTVVKDKMTGKKIIQNIGSLESFKAQITQSLRNKNENKNN